MLGTILEAVYKIKLGDGRVLGSVLLCGSFEGSDDGKLEGMGPGEGDPLGVS